MSQTDTPAPFSIETPEEARVFAAAAIATIEDLRELMREETRLILAARFREAADLSETKAGLVGSYARYMSTVNTCGSTLKTLAPNDLERLVCVHDTLSEVARENLPAVERARDTTFRIVKGINGLIEKRRAGPRTYGPGATEQTPQPTRSSPLSLDTAV